MIRLTALAALVGALVALGVTHWQPDAKWDGDILWVGARAVLQGSDPYVTVAEAGFQWPLYYPLPSVILFLPLALLPFTAARVVWAAVTAGLLGYAASRRPPLASALLSAAALDAIVLGQLSPLLTAGAVVPWLGAAWVTKPTIGLALFLAYPSRRAATGGMALLLVSVAVMPSWPWAWVDTALGATHLPPILRPGGALLLLALLRWRTSEGRFLAGLSCVPMTTGLYDALPLFLVARTSREAIALQVLTYAAWATAIVLLPRWIPGTPLEPTARAQWPVVALTLWLPALVMVLRPNGARKP